MLENLKQTLRRVEARFTPRQNELTFRDRRFSVVRSLWWDDATQASFEAEIIPYFKALDERTRFTTIIDAGAATVFFSISAGLIFPEASIFAFEPSPRQRIVLQRNLAKSNLADRVQIEGIGLWNKADRLSFRTHGAMSSFESVSELRGKMPFQESVEVKAFDHWAAENKLQSLDLVKMDIEGAEIEALEGAVTMLQRFHPELLVQAYHIRDGGRTYERCEQILTPLGYKCQEIGNRSGFLHAQYRG